MSSFQINALVRVQDNYAGGLDNVIGRIGRIVKEHEGWYLLDIEGTRQVQSYYGRDPYTFSYDVIVGENELELVETPFKDSNGRQVEIGDTILYSGNRSGFLEGKVVKFKIGEDSPYSNRLDVVKCQVEYVVGDSTWDGSDRRVPSTTTRRIWLENSERFFVLTRPYIFGGTIGTEIRMPGL